MNKQSVAYSALLLLSLIVVSVLLNRGVVSGVGDHADIGLGADKSSYISGQTITFTGTVDSPEAEEAFIHQVALVVFGPGVSDLDVTLPLQAGTAFNLIGQPGVTGSLLDVSVNIADLALTGDTLPGETLPTGTLPSGALPPKTCENQGTLPTTPPGSLPGGSLPSGGVLDNGTLPGTGLNGSGQFKSIGTGTLPGDFGQMRYPQKVCKQSGGVPSL